MDFFKGYDPLEYMRWGKLIEQETSNGSDRSIAIVSCSILDTQLEKLLKCFMINGYDAKMEDDLFDTHMPLSDFSSKIKMSFYLGIISKNEFNTLNNLRKIRNVFAHETCVTTFESSSKIIGLCSSLHIPEDMRIPEIIPLTSILSVDKIKIKSDNEKTPKKQFLDSFRYVSGYLELRITEIHFQKRTEYVAKKHYEVLQQLKNLIESYYEQSKSLRKQLDDAIKNHPELLLENEAEPPDQDNLAIAEMSIFSLSNLIDSLKLS